jgi:carbon-monoxide dehydrogenase medium subunit
MLPEFELLMPKTLPEALQVLGERAGDAMPLAGGTNLLVDMRAGARRPGVLVNIPALAELRGIRRENGWIAVGGAVTIAELLDSPLIADQAPVLRQGAAVLAGPLVRNRATLGGNLANASPAADTAPPLLVLGAEVELASAQGRRRLPLETFFTGPRRTVIQPGELLVAVRWPLPAPGAGGAFRKLALRRADAVAVVSVAVMVVCDGAGTCTGARIALGAVAPTPLRAHAAEAALQGQRVSSAEARAEAARLAAEATCCIDDVRAAASYRARVTDVLVQRLLAEVVAD